MASFPNWIRLSGICVAVLGLAIGGGISGGNTASSADALGPVNASPPVILISIDTLRADHLSAYGYRRIETPNIDSFAQGGIVFSNVACQTPLTLPSHTSLFTSTYPFENGIQENAEIVPAGAVTLAGILRSHSYKTGAFIGCAFLEREMGIGQGFDTYDSPFNFEAFSPISGELFSGGAAGQYQVHDRRDGALVVGAALRWPRMPTEVNQSSRSFTFSIYTRTLHAMFPKRKARFPKASPTTMPSLKPLTN